jgi:hypothetical protein
VGEARPAAQAQDGGDGNRGLTSPNAQVNNAKPECDDVPDRVGVVASFIAPLLIGRMRRGAIELRAHTVLLVQVVEVPVAGAFPDPRLPLGNGQAVRAFHPVDVAVFEQRQSTLVSNAAQSTVSRPGSPEKVAYTPRCSRCQRPLRTRVRIVSGSMPASSPWRRAMAAA